MQKYDVVIAGGSVSGLLAAREAAAGGATVAVLEEDAEIGTPEHCGVAPHHTSPPKEPERYAEFCAQMVRRYAC